MTGVKGKLILFFVALLISNVSPAQPLYITDKIPIPIYSEADKNSSLVKSLPSGTLVSLAAGSQLNSENSFVQIETKDGTAGWIEAIYLTNEKPTQLEYLNLAARHKAAEATIRDYETRLLDMQELRKEVKTTDWLRNQLNENRKREEAYEQQIKLKDIALADLKITIANLEDQLATAGQDVHTGKSGAPSPARSQQTFNSAFEDDSGFIANNSSIRFYTWLVLSLAVTLIIGILLGFVLIDYKVRKKSNYINGYS